MCEWGWGGGVKKKEGPMLIDTYQPAAKDLLVALHIKGTAFSRSAPRLDCSTGSLGLEGTRTENMQLKDVCE